MKCHGFRPDVQTTTQCRRTPSHSVLVAPALPSAIVVRADAVDAVSETRRAVTMLQQRCADRQTRAGVLECTVGRVCSRDVVSRPPPAVRRWVRIHLPSSPRAHAIGLVAASYVSDGELQVKGLVEDGPRRSQSTRSGSGPKTAYRRWQALESAGCCACWVW